MLFQQYVNLRTLQINSAYDLDGDEYKNNYSHLKKFKHNNNNNNNNVFCPLNKLYELL